MIARGAKKPLIFISYRRSDADALAGRIRDRMGQELPDWDVFMDVASIEPGENFRAVIDRNLARMAVFIVLVGRDWQDAGLARLHEPDDLVRREMAAALGAGVRVIPVLVNSATMPAADALPEELAAFADTNAVELRHSRFADDFANLLRVVTGEERRARPAPPVRRDLRAGLVGGLSGLVLVIAALALHLETTGKSASERIGTEGAALLVPLCVLIGAAIAVWIGRGRRRPGVPDADS